MSRPWVISIPAQNQVHSKRLANGPGSECPLLVGCIHKSPGFKSHYTTCAHGRWKISKPLHSPHLRGPSTASAQVTAIYISSVHWPTMSVPPHSPCSSAQDISA
jgi:hypothetical protein